MPTQHPDAAPDDRTVLFPDTYAASDPNRPAYVMASSGRTITYGELVASSRGIAALLWSRGLRHGDTVALLMTNNEHFLKVAWACQRAGLRYVALSTRLVAPEAAYIVNDCDAKAVIFSEDKIEVAEKVADLAPKVELWLTTGAPVRGFDALDPAFLSAPSVDIDEREGVDLLYSSGTTGRPKGVVAELTLPPLGTAPGFATLFHDLWGIDADTVYLSPAPLYHAAPLRVAMTVHRYGGTVIVMEKFDALTALQLIEQHRVTEVQLVPTMMIRMLKLPDEQRLRYDVSSLRCLVHAAAPCPADAKRQFIDWVGPIVREYYSATENYLFTELDTQEWLSHAGSVGRPIVGIPHILDESNNELPPGETGVIWAEAGLAFTYLNDPEKTAGSRNEQGWTTVGDLGYLDQDGYLYLSDRRSDLILAGGVNVYPQEAENILIGHPAVQDVAVFGLPHPEMGEVVHGAVVLEPSYSASPELEEELVSYCQERLASFKCPRRLDFLTELPRLPTGKLQRRLLRERFSGSSVS